MSTRAWVGVLAVAATVLAVPGHAEAREAFDGGSVRIGLNVGAAYAYGQRYVTIGGGVGYFVVDGLELGLDGETWVGGDPRISAITPQARYVLHFIDPVKPYVGVFFRHWFIEKSLPDQNSIGARVGALVAIGTRAFAGGGVVFERYLDCGAECTDIYPEIVVSVMF